MYDLVKRLRKAGFPNQSAVEMCKIAADEIERLRAALKRLEQIYNTDRIAATMAREIENIFDEQLHSSPKDTGETSHGEG